MSRYIDADALKYYGNHIGDEYEDRFHDAQWVYRNQIDDAPSIDIVRCKECRWGKPYSDKQLECDALGLGGLKFPNDYCSYGEREGE